MILTCPSCGTQYVVKDGAIPPEGRQVRCAACKHSWHQDPEESSAADALPATEPEPEAAFAPAAHATGAEEQGGEVSAVGDTGDTGDTGEDGSIAEATLIEPRSGPEAEERAFEEAAIDGAQPVEPEVADQATDPAGATYANAPYDMRAESDAAPAEDWREPPEGEAHDDEFTPFPVADEEEPPRRGRLLPIFIVVLAVIVIAAAFWFLAPETLKAKLGLGAAGATPLALVTTHMERRPLESGQELLTVTGRVINPTDQEQIVPPLQAQLKTRAGKVVYSWTIDPPARSLPAGASASFNSAEVNVPPGGDELTISLGSQAG